MFYVLLLLFGCTALAYLSTKKEIVRVDNQNERTINHAIGLSSIAFVVLLIILVCYSGLRTYSNDTTTYVSTFEKKIPDTLSEIGNIEWKLGNNPLFQAYQIVLKSVFSANGQIFLFVTALLTVTLTVVFFKKYSAVFGSSIFVYISFAVYAFSFAAMKQCLAAAIAIWAVPLFLRKKRITSILLIVIAMLIHTYVVVFFAFFFLHKNVWDKRAVLIIAVTIISGVAFTTVVDSALNLTSLIGEEYSINSFEGNSINVFRVFAYWAVPILSFIYRKEVREKNDRFLNICVNLSFVSACFVTLALAGAATPLGRMANYLDTFTCIALPGVITCVSDERAEKKYLTLLSYGFFFVYYLAYYNKFMPNFVDSLFTDYYAHVPIAALFKG